MENKKYFITSDIHSFYSPLKKALKQAGFKKTNPNHILIVAGDLFDRGTETLEVYKYIKSIPKSRLVLLRGNHEELFEEILEAQFPGDHDFSNGTVLTCCDIAGANIDDLSFYKVAFKLFPGDALWQTDWEVVTNQTNAKRAEIWGNIAKKVKESDFYQWFKAVPWKHYYELGSFIITHSFIPLHQGSPFALYRTKTADLKTFTDWRTQATETDLNASHWGCPYKLMDAGFFDEELKNGKTLVCGHWHAVSGHTQYGTDGYMYANDIYYSNKLIMLDACTVVSDQVNVLVVDENGECYDRYNRKLEGVFCKYE